MVYKEIIDERNRSQKNNPISFELEALSQLWTIAFKNNDSLPKSFTIKNVLMSKYMLEAMFYRMDINVTVECISSSHSASFLITLV